MSAMITYPFMEAMHKRHSDLRRDMERNMYSLAPQQTPFQNMFGGIAQQSSAGGAFNMSAEQRLAMQGNAAAAQSDVFVSDFGLRATLRAATKPYVHLRDRKAPPWPVDWWLE